MEIIFQSEILHLLFFSLMYGIQLSRNEIVSNEIVNQAVTHFTAVRFLLFDRTSYSETA